MRPTGRDVERVRLIKWVGDPVLVKEDGFGVPNWTYENSRVIVTPKSRRILAKGQCMEIGLNGLPIEGTGLTQTYEWPPSRGQRIIEVKFEDAQRILRSAGDEFKDVTDVVDPTKVSNDKIVVKAKKREHDSRR